MTTKRATKSKRRSTGAAKRRSLNGLVGRRPSEHLKNMLILQHNHNAHNWQLAHSANGELTDAKRSVE
jgi:hypothetical protein